MEDILPETEEELQGVLDTYKNIMMQIAPIILLAPDVTVSYMQTQRPYLWLVIRMIASKQLTRQLALLEETNSTIAQKVIVDGERSFDMLCALVIYLSWGQFSCAKANLSPLLHLAFALAGDLGLTKTAPQTSPGVMLNFTQAGCPRPPYALVVRPRTMEERRVLLGLFCVSSVYANFFQKNEPMRWSSYLEECITVLMREREAPTDEMLVLLARIQIIANGLQTDGWNEAYPTVSTSQKPPRSVITQIFKSQLDDLERTIPLHLKDNAILRFHLLGTRVSLYEHFLLPTTMTTPLDVPRQIEGLWACYHTVESYFDLFLSASALPMSSYLYVSMGVFGHLAHCLVVLFRLSTFECDGVLWDRQYVVQELDLGTVVEKWMGVMTESHRAAGVDAGSDSGWEYSNRLLLGTILKWWESKVRPSIMGGTDAQHSVAQEMVPTGEANTFDAEFPDLGNMDFNFDSEVWMRDMFSNGFDYRSF